MKLDWEERRSRFNHDWLANTFINRLQAFIERLEHESSDEGKLRRFLVEDWPTWPPAGQTARALLESFETEMSPARFLDAAPLRCLAPEIRAWLGPLVHRVWGARSNHGALLGAASTQLSRVEECFVEASEGLAPERLDRQTLRSRLALFADFLAACRELSRAFSALHEVHT